MGGTDTPLLEQAQRLATMFSADRTYEIFKALDAERRRGTEAERQRCLGIVTKWEAQLQQGEYIDAAFRRVADAIKAGGNHE